MRVIHPKYNGLFVRGSRSLHPVPIAEFFSFSLLSAIRLLCDSFNGPERAAGTRYLSGILGDFFSPILSEGRDSGGN